MRHAYLVVKAPDSCRSVSTASVWVAVRVSVRKRKYLGCPVQTDTLAVREPVFIVALEAEAMGSQHKATATLTSGKRFLLSCAWVRLFPLLHPGTAACGKPRQRICLKTFGKQQQQQKAVVRVLNFSLQEQGLRGGRSTRGGICLLSWSWISSLIRSSALQVVGLKYQGQELDC